MIPPLKPARFHLDEQQLAAALALGGIRPERSSALPDLPAPADPAKALADTGALANGGLSPEADAALRVAAAPTRLVSVVSALAGSPSVLETVFLSSSPDGPIVAQAITDRVELALLPTAAHAAVAVDELLRLTDVPVEPGEEGWSFSLAGYAALLALSDAIQRSYLEARLSRRPGPKPEFTARDLEDVLAAGLAAIDTRWAVTAAKYVCPLELASARGKLADGVAELVSAGLAERGAGGAVSTTQMGYEVAASLGQLLAFGGLSVKVATAPERALLAQTTVLRGMFRIWLGTWSPDGASMRVRLTGVSALSAIEFVRGMLEIPVPAAAPWVIQAPPLAMATAAAATQAPAASAPAASAAPTSATTGKFCPECGTPTVPGKAFCASCGAKLTL